MSKQQLATLQAEVREGKGKGAARALRRDGKVPAVVYSAGKPGVHIALNLNELTLQYMKGRFHNKLLELDLAKEGKVKTLPKSVQTHPVTDKIEHVDFLRVDEKTPIRVQVPVKFLNQEKSVGIKRGGVLNIVRHEIEFQCMPNAIPDHIEIDVIDRDIGASIHIKDVTLPEGITPVIKRNFTVATIAGRSAADEAVETPTVAAATAEGAAAAPAEGAAAPAKEEKK